MTAIALTLPLARRSPARIPRRDLALDAGDTLTLQLTLVESDRPGSAPLDLAGLGPVVRFLVAYDPPGFCWDYGRPAVWPVLGAVAGTILAAPGRADVVIPAGFFRRWGLRLGWGVQLAYGDETSLIAWGALHVQPGVALAVPAYDLLDSNDATILTDTDQDVEA